MNSLDAIKALTPDKAGYVDRADLIPYPLNLICAGGETVYSYTTDITYKPETPDAILDEAVMMAEVIIDAPLGPTAIEIPRSGIDVNGSAAFMLATRCDDLGCDGGRNCALKRYKAESLPGSFME